MWCSVLKCSKFYHFILQLKGCSRKEAEKETVELLQRLNLINKKNQMSSTLSGGMKRKLSLGIALIGNSTVRNYLQQPLHFGHVCFPAEFLLKLFCSSIRPYMWYNSRTNLWRRIKHILCPVHFHASLLPLDIIK